MRWLKILLGVAGVLAIIITALNLFLPARISSAFVSFIKERTGKDARIGSLSVNVLTGLSARDISLCDGTTEWVRVQSVSADFSIFSLLTGKLLVTSLEIDTPCVFLERRQDGSLNLQQFIASLSTETGSKRKTMPIVIRSVSLRSGSIKFSDHTASPELEQEIEKLDIEAALSLPGKITFELSASPAKSSAFITARGNYRPRDDALSVAVTLKDLRAGDIPPIVRRFGISDFTVNGTGYVESGPGTICIKTDSRVTGLALCLGKTEAAADVGVKASFTFEKGKGLRDYSGTAFIEKGELSLPARPLTLRGPVEFSGSGLSWKGVRIGYAGQKFLSSGKIDNFADPSMRLGIYSKEMILEGTATSRNKLLTIERLWAWYRGSRLSLSGTMDLSRLPALPAQLSATGNIELSDAGIFLSGMQEWKKAAPAGVVNAGIRISGDLREWMKSSADIKVKGSRVCAYGLSAGNLTVDYTQAEGRANSIFNFSFYDGTVNGDAAFDLSQAEIPFCAQVSAEGIHLEKLKMDTALCGRDLAGTLSLDGAFSGRLIDMRNLEGTGNVSVVKGRLWQLDILKGLGQMLFPELLTITFEKATSDFQVKKGAVYAKELNLVSTLVELAARGSVTFDGCVDWLVHIQLSNTIIPRLGKIKQIASFVLRQTTGRLVAVKINGTADKPRYTVRQPLISDVFDSLRDLVGVRP